MILPITLTTAGAAALINLWLAVRIVGIRHKAKIRTGDGGNPLLLARMRAQLNFAEYAPIVLILIGLVELATGTSLLLWVAAAVFIAGRLLHPFGMDGWLPGRGIGIATTMLVMLGLGGYAAYLGFTHAQRTPQAQVFSIAPAPAVD